MSDPSHASLNGRSAAVLFLHAQTALHPGSGTALGTVDLPVQRERHTQWPTIAGSALKGILRDTYREARKDTYQDEYEEKDGKRTRKRSRRQVANEDDPEVVAIFGPGKVDESSAHAGALSVTDARILAFPVRSLRGVFAWVTCPAVLERLNRDLKLVKLGPLPEIPRLEDNQIACVAGSPLLVGPQRDKVVLEEFEFTRAGAECTQLANWIAGHAVADESTKERLRSHLAVLSDNDFRHFVLHATEVVARIGLDYEQKTVKEGALFYQEFLPAETIFYTLVLASESRKPNAPHSAAEILGYVGQCVKNASVVQIGGDETTGKGLCTLRWCEQEKED